MSIHLDVLEEGKEGMVVEGHWRVRNDATEESGRTWTVMARFKTQVLSSSLWFNRKAHAHCGVTLPAAASNPG